MQKTRIYQAVPLNLSRKLLLDEQASNHVARVLRAERGDELTLFNGQGGEYNAIITQIDKKRVEVEIGDFLAIEKESSLDICLAQGIAKGEKMDFIIQKAVELGVKSIIPLLTERSNVKLDQDRQAKRLSHWRAIAISACEQSGRNRIPEILNPNRLTTWLPLVNSQKRYVLSPYASAHLSIEEKVSATTITLLIGPEGGLSDMEVILAVQHGFTSLKLGPRIMRTETASIAALALLQFCDGDFK